MPPASRVVVRRSSRSAKYRDSWRSGSPYDSMPGYRHLTVVRVEGFGIKKDPKFKWLFLLGRWSEDRRPTAGSTRWLRFGKRPEVSF